MISLTQDELTVFAKIIKVNEIEDVKLKTMLSGEESKKAMEGLKAKNVLKDDTFSNEAILLSEVIKRYSKATRYLKFGSGCYGKVEDEYIGVIETEEGYSFVISKKEELIVIIMNKLIQNGGKIGDGKYRQKSMKKENFLEYMQEHPETGGIFYIKIDKKEQRNEPCVVYVEDERLKTYSTKEQVIKMYPKDWIEKGMEGIFDE